MTLNERNILNSRNLRRLPWIKEEDEAIISLVEKLGTKNWTLVASKLAELFESNNRTGKQCRERWHNHLDHNIKKEYWTEKEEAILFTKHMEYGNKWSDIAKFLPGRTDNCIKNHFYSKLRKFIRKILKALHQENVFQQKGIDSGYYNSDRIYKIIKKNNIPYNLLSKDIILDLILLNDQSHSVHPKILNMKRHHRRKLRKIGFFSLSKIKRRKMVGDVEKNNLQKGQNAKMNRKYRKDRNSNANEIFNKENINDINFNPQNDIHFGNRLKHNKIGMNEYNYQSNENYLPNLANNHPLKNNLMNNNIYNSVEGNIQESIIKALSQNLYAKNSLSPQNFPTQPEYTIELLQKLSKLSNDSRLPYKENNQDRNSFGHFNFSGNQASGDNIDFYTFNNRFFPQANYENNMSSFTLANNSSMNNSLNVNIMQQNYINDIENQSFVNNSNCYNFPQVKQGDININNLMIAGCGMNNFNNNVNINNSLMNSNYNLNKSHHDLNENLKNQSYSFESDCIFQDKYGFYINNMANLPKMNQAFSQLKSFNCLDADLLYDDSNYSSILNKQSNLAKVNTNINNSIKMNVNNSFPSYSRNLLDNCNNNIDLQTYLNMKNSNQPFNYSNISGIVSNNTNSSLPITPNMTSRQNTQIISPSKPPAANRLSISPKSAFVKNFEINK